MMCHPYRSAGFPELSPSTERPVANQELRLLCNKFEHEHSNIEKNYFSIYPSESVADAAPKVMVDVDWLAGTEGVGV